MAKKNPEFNLTEEEMIRQLEEADPDPQSTPLPAFTEKGRPLPPATTPKMTEEEMIRQMQEADPDPDEQPDIPAWQVPWEAGSNFGQSARKFFGGMWDSITHPYETGEALGKMIAGGAANLMTPDVRAAMVKENPGLQEKIDAANAVGQEYVNRYGSGQKILNTMGRDPVGFAADASTFIPGMGALNPTRVLNGPAHLAGRTTRAVVNNLDPQGNMVLRAAEGMESQYLNQLRSPNNVLVPGSVPNAGQAVAEPGGSTRWQAMVNSAEQRASTRAGQLEHARQQARVADVDQVGRNHNLDDDLIARANQDPTFDPSTATIEELQEALRAADAANYGPLDTRVVTADDTLIDLLNRPSGDIVQAIAREIAAEEGRPFQIGENAPAQSTPSSVLGPDGRPVMVNTPAEYASYLGEDLIRIKKAFDRLASSRELRAKYAIDDDAARQIAATRSQFVNWMEAEGRLPEHATAVADSRAWRQLIDRRRAGQVFSDVLTGPMPDQIKHRSIPFANLFDSPRNALTGNSSVGKATRFDYDNWAQLLTPEDMEILQRNLSDLSREKLALDLARKGNRHSRDIDAASEGVRAPAMLQAPITITNALMDRLTGLVNSRISERVANAMLTPDGAAEILERAINRRQTLDDSSQAWRNLGESIQLMHRAPAGYNALQYEREQRNRNNL